MPSFDIVRKSEIAKTFRNQAVVGTYDLQDNVIEEHFVGNIDIPEQWQVGIIVGNSGTGKTTIAKELFPDAYLERFEYGNKSIVDEMPTDGVQMSDIYQAFNSVGLASVPTWLKPYSVLSNGEKMRCDLARALLTNQDLFVFDEFTSVVDRDVAKVGSFAIQKAIRKSKKRFIAVSCHFDIIDWLLPDWIFDTNSMTFRTCEGQKKNRPTLQLNIYRVESRAKEYYWRMFAKYHYLSHSFNKAADVYVATIGDKIVAFNAVLPFPHPRVKNTYKEHRTVVLPDYQGIGISRTMTNYIASTYKARGKAFISTTSNPAMIHSRANDPNWIMTHKGRLAKPRTGKISMSSGSFNRITCSFKYIGD